MLVMRIGRYLSNLTDEQHVVVLIAWLSIARTGHVLPRSQDLTQPHWPVMARLICDRSVDRLCWKFRQRQLHSCNMNIRMVVVTFPVHEGERTYDVESR